MVRETRHLWVGNLPDNIREDRIREHFKRYGRVQSVKLLPRSAKDETTSEGTTACTVAFMDIKSAAKAHVTEHKIDDRTLTTEYYEPAAIPSAASPQNTTSAYSTSPGTNRFPNGHGSTDDHGSFSERFYDRNTNRVSDGEYIRRSSGYHENNRGRNRDRGYRNGPYNSLLDRPTHRVNSGSTPWTATYDTTARYNNQNSDTGYSTAPSENSDRRAEQSTKKKTKSRSGSRSPSPSGSTSSRSPSRSRSRSSSSSSSSSTSRATSSTGSPKSRRVPAGNQYQSAVHSEDRRPLAICVRNLPCRSSDTSLKDGLFHEYKKHGKVTWVKVVGQSSERHAIVCFKKPEDVEKALEVSYDKLFFGSKIEVAPYQGHELDDNDSRLFEAEIDEFHPKATRTLFIGNLEKDVTASDLRKEFDQFGEIIEIDIKKQGVVSSYAFCQYSDIVSVVKAIRTLDGEHLGNNRIKLGFGKSMPTSCVWVDGVSESVSEKYLKMQFEAFGTVPQVSVDREKGQALVFYDQVVNAQAAVKEMRGISMKGRKIQVDFASRECQEAFYDHLEKQGHAADRIGTFEERRDSTSRTFEVISSSARFSRYDTPTRPRTSSYSSRSSATTSQCNASAIPSPGTPGSATPRGSGSRSRVPRYAPEYYDQNSEYSEQRHFRNYDEYSQGSAASHEDNYEHEYIYHESPSHLEALERLQTTSDHPASFPQPDIRNLQKERVHLLEQLEEYPSSGDELISPKKKLKLEHLDGAIISDVIIEANRDHRKVMEVRRLSDTTNTKHHSRRPSVDGKYRDVTHDRGSYLPHAVCKRRKTGGSDNGSRVHHYDQSGSESIGGSRPGTPLCDERPEHIPTEPRRTPRDREGPLSLPLPRFAAQVLHKGSISVAGIKGQKDNILSSPPAAVTSPRISNPKPPSPVHVPPPASPPPRPPSLSSTSSDSDVAPHSPSLDERIRSLDEKYEKWSGSRALSAAGGDVLLKLDANREKFKFKHKLLDLDLKEVQPSEIVKSVMAKRSVFDEDTKRLENVGEKYEPRDFNSFPKTSAPVQPPVPAASSIATPVAILKVSTAPMLKVSPVPLPKTPTMLSPRSTSTGITPAKGLQYPFPTHPPPLVVVATTTPMTTTVFTLTSSITTALSSSTGTTPVPNISSSTVNTTILTMTTTTSTPSSSSPSCSQLTTAIPCPQSSHSSSGSSVSSSSSTASSSSSSATPTGTALSAIRANHGDNRLKPCVSGVSSAVNNSSSTSGDNNRTSSKVSSVNRNVTNNNNNNNNNNVSNNNSAVLVGSSSSCQKSSSDTSKNTSNNNLNNIPQQKDVASTQDTNVVKSSKSGRGESKTNSEKSTSSRSSDGNKSRKNSETRKNDSDYPGDNSCDSAEMLRMREERDRLEKERIETEKRLEKERIEREERERQERERLERERERQEKLEKERLEKERLEKERQERLRKEREERERREREERERKEREEREERERQQKEREERERREKEREERERREKEREERERKEKEERERREEEKREKREREEREERERREREEAERIEREKRKEEERRHKEDNHEKRKDEHRHRETHLDNRYTNHDSSKGDGKNAVKEEGKKDELTPSKRDHDSRFHESRESKNRHHDRDSEKRKDSVKENRESNSYDKVKTSEIRENKDRPSLETRHLSIDLEKTRQSDVINKTDPSRRKERNNSLPVNVGNKRRLSCHDSVESVDEPKKMKMSQDHKKVSERRNSKDVSNREEKVKSKHKSSTNSSKHEDKSARSDKHNNISHDEKRKDRDEKHKTKQKDKQKSKSKNRDKESSSTPNTPGKDISTDKDFLSRLESMESEKQKRKESKEKKKQDSENEERRTEDGKRSDESKIKEKFSSSERSKREEQSKLEEKKSQKKDRIRKITNSSDNTDSDEPKKHSIFDIVDDEPAYISMYDKVKARSCKNMQKQEEEKRQEKIKAKFSQLKQSRAKREEKKRSTSWDEDSDSEKECKTRKGSKLLIRSSDEEDNTNKIPRRKEIYSDSDSEKNQVIKHCSNIDSSDDDHIKNSNLQRKGSKSRIASDTSDDEFKITTTKHEVISDNEDQPNLYNFGENLFNKIKEEVEEPKYIKKEKKNSIKHQSMKIFGDASSGDEIMEKKEKIEGRKKHKKKQKKQKNSISSEESSKLESLGDSIQSEGYEKIKNAEKKKQHSKKDKKRDKSKDENREKSKKSRKTKENKRDGKMENIFGSLSDDSENGTKEQISGEHRLFHMGCVSEDNIQSMYASDSDGVSSMINVSKETYKSEERERNMKEEHRKRKEKKRREKEKQRKREEMNENSIDFIDLGKQLEENIKDDSNEAILDVKLEPAEIKTEQSEDVFVFSDIAEVTDIKKEDRKENREKKKKRKKNKEEKQRHHHHHHEKNKNKSPEFKKELSRVPSPVPLSSTPTDIEIKVEIEKQGQSLPNLLDIPSPPQNKSSPNLDISISPAAREPMISPIPKTSTSSKEKKREKFIPGFGSEIDEKIHESAVKSIPEFEQPKQEPNEIRLEDTIKDEKPENSDEKPRVVISQEETEDAVAALLGESFGSGQFEDCYNEQQMSPINTDQVANISDENNVQDDEEMRQAVRSLNSSDLDMKPDTPQSEHELQIDTDTEEQEEVSLRYDHPPKTPDTVDLSQPPKTPDISNSCRNEEPPPQQPPKTTIVIKTTSIGSPPSLTPIKQEPKNIIRSPLPQSMPMLPEQRSVISKSWMEDQKEEISEIPAEPKKKIEEPLPPLTIQTPQFTPVVRISNSPKPYTSIPALKMAEPVLSDTSKQMDKQLKPESPKTPSSISVLQTIKTSMHNVPPHIPYPVPSQKLPNEAGLVSPKLATSISRLPITSVQVVSKPLQTTTLVLPQPKQAQTSEPLKLISTDRPRMIYQGTPNLQQFATNFGPRMIQKCGLPPQSLLLPNKTSYTAMRLSVKGNSVIERPLTEPPKLVPTSSPITPQNFDLQQSQSFSQVRNQQQNFPQTSQIVQQTVQVTQPSFTSLPLPFQSSPSIIVSSHSNLIKPVPVDTVVTPSVGTDIKTFTPVIQEAPKLVTNVHKPEVRPQPAVIQQAPPKPTAIQQNIETHESKVVTPPVETVKEEVIRTSTPSPVIVPNLPTKLETPVKLETPKEKVEIPPQVKTPEPQLAIEKVTEELNLSLEKEVVQKVEEKPEIKQEKSEPIELENLKKDLVKTEEIKKEHDVKSETPENIKSEKEREPEPVKTESEGISVIKEIEKIDEEKADTDSVVSDISKERLSAEILSKDDPLDSKEDSDYWSAKEVNIESVIQTVDALCSADDLSDRSSELGKDDWFDENKIHSSKPDGKADVQTEVSDKKDIENDVNCITNDSYCDGIENIEEKEVVTRGNGRRGGRPRGSKKNRATVRVGVQTRRAKIKETTPAKRGGRGGRPKNERKIAKADLESCTDIYEFRDDSDDAKDRPRLILTIKQQAPNSANGNSQQTAIVKEVPKSVLPPTPPKIVETKEEFTSPVSNTTRKSRRLQEKDASRNTVDDTIEDVIKNTAMVTRSCTAMAQGENGPRRSTRQSTAKALPETPRKSPRSTKKKDRRASETTDDSSEEKIGKPEITKNEPSPHPSPVKEEQRTETKEEPKEIDAEEPKEKPKEKPHEGLKATVLRRVKGDITQEPMTLIDPVTGLLTPMRECEEGKYIPISGSQSVVHAVITTSTPVISQPSVVVSSSFPKVSDTESVVTSPVMVKTSKPQSLKAHVLSSQAAKAVVSQNILPHKPVASQNLPQPTFTPNSINQHLSVNVSSVPSYVPPHLSPRPAQAKALHNVKLVPSQLSPNHQMTILQKPPPQQQTQPQHKVINPVIQSPMVNTQIAHIKPVVKQPGMMKQPQIAKHPPQPPLVLNKSGMMVKHPMHQQPVIGVTGRVPQTTVANKVGVDPPKVEVSMAGCVMVPRSNVSQQSQPRHVLQPGMPVPAYEASPHGERGVYNRSRSPPPAHQNSPSPQGEAMGAHFPPGSVQLRPPHDLSASHYLHAPHVVYQQLLRQYIPRSPMVSVEKTGDGQEGEEAPVTSPPLELRRPGSVGLALSGRSNAVHHSLQSPHDRTTDSPQVYSMHQSRVQHYNTRYYDEPPPAHRPVTSHGSLASLGSDRPLSHMGPLGTPDRPLSAHSAVSHLSGLGTPDRSMTTHLPERPLSGHGMALSAGLGAAGNLMGAVARHVGADAPASQRGIQAATPPHASQVPPQAESLLMLLKQYPCMWQGLLALKNDQAAVQMYFVSGNDAVAKCSLPKNSDGSTPPLRIFQRMRLEPPQVEGVARKMQMENEHCMLLALPCGHDHMDVLKQSTNLNNGFITYLQQKQAAGIVNVAAPGTTQPPAYVVHIFPSCDFVNENLRRIAPSLLERVADIAHLLIVITTV